VRGILAIVNLIRHRLTPLLTGGERHRRPPRPNRDSFQILFGQALALPHPGKGDFIHSGRCRLTLCFTIAT